MRNHTLKIMALLLALVVILPQTNGHLNAQGHEAMNTEQQTLISTNLLINGDMDQLGFYPRPTNHYVARMWYEWWTNYTAIPEYIDGGIPEHNQCYPPVSGLCHGTNTNNSSQGYIRMGAKFGAGIYQPVSSTIPCTFYRFEMWNRNDSNDYQPRVGIEPTGWVLTQLGNSLPNNCPPDGLSRCPDPYMPLSGFPNTMVWGPIINQAAYTWALKSVEAEALATSISVWAYTAPDTSGSQSTYWDYGSLVQIPYPNNRLPEPASWTPTSLIGDLSATTTTTSLSLNWTTSVPAMSQVWYTITPPQPPVTPTVLTYTAYLPIVSKAPVFNLSTTPNLTPATQHQATITGLNPGDTVTFVILARRLQDGQCITEAAEINVILIK